MRGFGITAGGIYRPARRNLRETSAGIVAPIAPASGVLYIAGSDNLSPTGYVFEVDGGIATQILTSGLLTETILVDGPPNDPTILWAFGPEDTTFEWTAVYSTDSGANWTADKPPVLDAMRAAHATSQAWLNMFHSVVANGGVYRAATPGGAWSQIIAPSVSEHGPGLWYNGASLWSTYGTGVIDNPCLHRSNADGSGLININLFPEISGEDTFMPKVFGIGNGGGDRVYCCWEAFTGIELLKRVDDTTVTDVPIDAGWLPISVCVPSTDVVLVHAVISGGTNGRIYRSTNAGVSWSIVEESVNLVKNGTRTITMPKNGSGTIWVLGAYASPNVALFSSADGITWSETSVNIGADVNTQSIYAS